MKTTGLFKAPVFIISLIAITFLFPSCGAIMKAYIKDDGVQMPPNFGREKATILAIKHGNGYNKKLKKYFKKYYTGEYILVTEEELKTTYADVARYRFIFERSGSSYMINVATPNNPGHMTRVMSYSFHLQDRTDNKYYSADVSSGAYAKVMKAYLQELEKARMKHESESLTSH